MQVADIVPEEYRPKSPPEVNGRRREKRCSKNIFHILGEGSGVLSCTGRSPVNGGKSSLGAPIGYGLLSVLGSSRPMHCTYAVTLNPT